MIESATGVHPWMLCLNALKEKLSETAFSEWIEPLKFGELDGAILTLTVPSAVDLEKLEQSYSGLIEFCFFEANGKQVQVRFERAPQPSAAARSTQTTSFCTIPAIDLNPSYTFEEFVVGSNSQFAHSAAHAVAKDPGGTRFNPLLIYGGVGLGKTHLLQAIGNKVREISPGKRSRYVTSETFYREFVESIQHNRISELSNFYRNEVDLLLMDDVQFLSGKDRTQEEFFHIFNALHQSRKQIVLTSDASPGALKGLEDRLVSRFQWGLFVDIQLPDRETREAILKKKAQTHNLSISEEIIAYLAEAIDSNIRIMEGAVRQLLLQASIKHSDITMELAQEIVNRIVSNRTARTITIEEITSQVAKYFVVEIDKIMQRGRGTKEVAQARQASMFLVKELTSASLKTIGQRFGGRDHSTVVHAIKTIESLMEKDSTFKKHINGLIAELNES